MPPQIANVVVMREWTLILLMLVSLIACPFDCMGRMTAGGVTDTCSGRCCCCSRHQTNSDTPTPTHPTEQRCDCICNGALITDSVVVNLDCPSSCHVGPLLIVAPGLLFHTEESQDNRSAISRLRLGRSLHLALHSLQV